MNDPMPPRRKNREIIEVPRRFPPARRYSMDNWFQRVVDVFLLLVFIAAGIYALYLKSKGEL